MMDFRAFEEFCESRGVELLPHQRNFAAAILASDEHRTFFLRGLGSGRTFVYALLESFADQYRREHREEVAAAIANENPYVTGAR
jgi:hypothetical protein